MGASALLPLLGAVIGGVVAGSLRRYLEPSAAARLLTVVAVSSALAVAWALVLVVFGWAIAYPQVDDVAAWCQIATPGHHPVGTALGLGALAVLLTGTARAIVAFRRFRRADAAWCGSDPIEIMPFGDPVAFCVPGRPGRVIVSTGLVRDLTQPLFDAVLAHEQAHLTHRHHRYVRWTRLAVTAVPLLYPLDRWVSISTERWADEEAACVIGDRKVVADALVATATATARSDGTLGFNRSHLRERVDALRNPPALHPHVVTVALMMVWVAVATSLLSNSVELHHLASFAEHVCTRS